MILKYWLGVLYVEQIFEVCMSKISIKRLIGLTLLLLVIVLVVMTIHQRTHFNRNVEINHVQVGGLTRTQALTKLEKTRRATKVYINNELVYQGKRRSLGFSDQDQSKIDRALKDQATFFPSNSKQNLVVVPAKNNYSESPVIEQAVNEKIGELNQGRRAPRDAYAVYEHGQVKVIPAVLGTKYSLSNINQRLEREIINGTIKLKPKYDQPLSANSKQVQREKQRLERLAKRTVTYQVQDKKHHLKASDIITKATYHAGQYHFDLRAGKDRIRRINIQQATLNKPYTFKTHAGNMITTDSQGSYGWKLSENQATKTLTQALLAGKKIVNAKNDVTGTGYNKQGTGYQTTTNHGIGQTYAEVSLSQQHAWFYKDGKCVLDTDIVSGTDNKGNQTPPGVWYIMYQQTPSILRGTNDDGSRYASKVQYWSPFTLSGCGFHDASWRHDWSKKAYLKGGSHGCINMHPDVAEQAFHDLAKNEPVIIY